MANIANILSEHGLLIATHNQGKLTEIQALLAKHRIQCYSADDKHLDEPEEDGETFIENAMIKSLAAAQITNMPCLADDSGLVVPALGGDPGIYSARWAGPDKNFDYAMKSVRIALEAKKQPLDSEAYFVCVLSLALPGALLNGTRSESVGESATSASDQRAALCDFQEKIAGVKNKKFSISTTELDGVQCINVEGRVYGKLTFPPRGQMGFGYDPIFIPDGMEQTFAEIDSDTKQSISHRANAFNGLIEVIGG